MRRVFSFFMVTADFILYKYTKIETNYTGMSIKYQKMTNFGAKRL